jgi:acyl-coenzyme A synthetase/AMP-(fatty) acid ligase
MTNHNIAQILRQNSKDFSNKNALTWADDSGKNYSHLSYEAFENKTNAQAYMLSKEGIRAGDKVVFLVKPGPSMYSLIFALYKIGAIPVLVDPGMGLKRMLHCYQSVNARAFIGITAATILKTLVPSYFSTIEITITVRNENLYRGFRRIDEPVNNNEFPIHNSAPDDLLHIAFTTGSTGPAKAVECTHAMAHSMKNIIMERYFYEPKDVELITIPFIGVLTLLIGNTGVMPKMDAGKPAKVNPLHIIDAINRFKASCITASPALFNVLGQHGKNHPYTLDSIRFASSGGAPTSISTMKSLAKVLTDQAHFDVSWGATEALPLAAMNVRKILASDALQASTGKGSCLGTPMNGVEVCIMKNVPENLDSFKDAPHLAQGEVGEIVVSGANVSKAYHQDEESNRIHKVFYGGKVWHRTGDLGYVDENQLLWFCGRKSEVIESSLNQAALHSVQCEGIVNSISEVYRSALVKATIEDKPGSQKECPIICVEVEKGYLTNETRPNIEALRQKILNELIKHEITQNIEFVMFHPSFPVDIRHNAKINRKALGDFASKQLSIDANSLGLTKPNWTLTTNPWMLIPILGWLYIIYGCFFPLEHWLLQTAWVIDMFLSTVIHIMQIPTATRKAAAHAYAKNATRLFTLIFGATWWKAL